MNRKYIRFVLALMFSSFVARAWAQPLPPLPPPEPAGGETPEVESQVPGETQIVRWDVLLNQSGADAIKKIGTPAKSDSQIYQATTCSGFEIRAAVADAITNGGIEAIGNNMSFGQSYNNGQNYQAPQTPQLNYYSNSPNGARNFNFNGYFQQQGQDSIVHMGQDHLHLHLNSGQLNNGMIMEGNRQTKITVSPTIQFDGDLAPGDAVAFLAPFTGGSQKIYYQLSVWETFKAQPELMELFRSENDSGWWAQNGPTKLRKAAGIAAIWQSQATHSFLNAPAAYVKKLDDGKEVRLVALGRPDDYKYIWWDGAGNPVSGMQNQFRFNTSNDTPVGLVAIVELHGNANENRRRSPATRPVNSNMNNNFNQGLDQQTSTRLPDGQTQIKIGVAVGDWKEIGLLNIGEPKEIDGITYTVDQNQQIRVGRVGAGLQQQMLFLTLKQSQQSDDIVAISPVNADGMEAVSMNGMNQPMIFDNQNPNGRMMMGGQFQGFSADDVKYVRLCVRKRQWVTFDNFAAQPATAIKSDFAPDDLTAALKIWTDRQAQIQKEAQEDNMMRPQIFRTQFDNMPSDPTTAPGTLRLLLNAAQRGDEKSIRQVLTAPAAGPDINSGLDALAHYYAVSASNWNQAARIFDDGQMISLRLTGVPLRDMSGMFSGVNWSKGDNGEWDAGTDIKLTKGSDGNYLLDVSGVLAGKDVVAQIQKMSAVQDRISQALSQPNATTEQIRVAAQ